jgi:hypothetical protein
VLDQQSQSAPSDVSGYAVLAGDGAHRPELVPGSQGTDSVTQRGRQPLGLGGRCTHGSDRGRNPGRLWAHIDASQIPVSLWAHKAYMCHDQREEGSCP